MCRGAPFALPSALPRFDPDSELEPEGNTGRRDHRTLVPRRGASVQAAPHSARARAGLAGPRTRNAARAWLTEASVSSDQRPDLIIADWMEYGVSVFEDPPHPIRETSKL